MIKFNRKLKFNVTTKYCRKFCSTGFCPKGINCSFTHDVSKIAICQRFIYGKCKSSICLLSHQKNPEKMPDCSFFANNACNLENCCFRHVKVTANSELCKDFLKGLCLLGSKCEKSHRFLCRTFLRTGNCPKGNKCYFAHRPKKNKRKSKLETQSKFKKINSITHNVNKESKTYASTPINLSNKAKLLDSLLTKHLNSPALIRVRSSSNEPMKWNFDASFIKLSSDGGNDSSKSKFENNRKIITRLFDDKSESNKDPSIGQNEPKLKYFDNDDEDDKDKSIISLKCSSSSSSSDRKPNSQTLMRTIKQKAEASIRPKLKIIPDFLL
uniref:Zinc finger CCCH domain-containing protein 3 n=1 Tax=Sarcoptes scabiei TaxID=52283 RepID=A0A834VEZ8_SARSC